MTRKDFELIAAAIERAPMNPADRRAAAYELANSLSETNPQFDRRRFLVACGTEQSEVVIAR